MYSRKSISAKNDLYCNETNFADGIEPSYPYQETTMTLCITHGYGDFDNVINPVCDIWRSNMPPMTADPNQPFVESYQDSSEIQCRVYFWRRMHRVA